MVTAPRSCDVMRYGPRITVRGSRCAVVQLQMYTEEKDVITSKLAVFDATLLLHKPYLSTFWILFSKAAKPVENTVVDTCFLL